MSYRMEIAATLLALLVVRGDVCAANDAVAQSNGLRRILTGLKQRIDINPRTGFPGFHDWTFEDTKSNKAQLARAGSPQLKARWARGPEDRNYDGYYIGGGATRGGDQGRYVHEGTWGWEYTPWWSKVRLGWFHGRRFQAGEGQYNPDRKSDPLQDFRNP